MWCTCLFFHLHDYFGGKIFSYSPPVDPPLAYVKKSWVGLKTIARNGTTVVYWFDAVSPRNATERQPCNLSQHDPGLFYTFCFLFYCYCGFSGIIFFSLWKMFKTRENIRIASVNVEGLYSIPFCLFFVDVHFIE